MELRSLTCWTVTLALIGIALVAFGFCLTPQFARTTLHVLGLAALAGAIYHNRQLISRLEQTGDEE